MGSNLYDFSNFIYYAVTQVLTWVTEGSRHYMKRSVLR